MTREEKEIALYCLKASSDYHSEVCEECVKYPNCDHTIQDDVTETIIKALEQEPKIGHWVKKSQYGNDYCSECDYELLMYENPKYCPNCGARMSESKFFAKVAESYCKGLRDGLTVESEDKE